MMMSTTMMGSTTSAGSNAALRKLVGRAARRASRAAGAERFYDYTLVDAPIQGEYFLRGDEGTYREDWGWGVLHGKLTFISNEPIEIEGNTFNGFRYSGTDDTGDYLYFFGSDDLGDVFVVGIFGSDFTAEQLILGALASRVDA
jgi:hypothetical protein